MNTDTKTVLIVEDDKDIAHALELRLRHLGFMTVVAHDAPMATKFAREMQPDLGVLDISLPGGDGFDVAERMRRLVSPSVPLIFITASKRPGLRESADRYGPIAYFEKPYAADELMAAVSTVI